MRHRCTSSAHFHPSCQIGFTNKDPPDGLGKESARKCWLLFSDAVGVRVNVHNTKCSRKSDTQISLVKKHRFLQRSDLRRGTVYSTLQELDTLYPKHNLSWITEAHSPIQDPVAFSYNLESACLRYPSLKKQKTLNIRDRLLPTSSTCAGKCQTT